VTSLSARPTRHARVAAPGTSDPGAATRKATPVKWWAAVGVGALALQVGIWASWISSERFTTTTFGRSEVPGWIHDFAIGWQIATVIGLVFIVHRWVVRPIRREGRFSIEGMLVVILGLLYWQDPIANYTQNWFGYNTTLVNFGSWTMDIPGWVAPAANRLPEPFLWVASSYVFVLAPGAIFGAWLMRRAKARWPSLGKLGLIMVAFGAMFTLDLVFELIWVRFALYSYGGPIKWMTLFHGHYYQFPVYEAFLFGGCMAAFSSLVYFRNDKGETVADRRASDLRVAQPVRTALRFFALLGICNVILLSYNVATQWFALRADTWVRDVQERPYLTDGFCGPNTEYSCSGPAVPIPRPDSAHLDPEGDLEVPDGTTLRDESRIDQ
jgi:hypothetical protein